LDLVIPALSFVLLAGAAAFTFVDYQAARIETPAGRRLGDLYLLDDSHAVKGVWARLGRVDSEAVAAAFRSTLERDAGSAERWGDLGDAVFGLGDRRRAEYCYRRAADLAPGDLDILFDLGDFYKSTGDTSGALSEFSGILRQSNSAGEGPLRHNIFVYYELLAVRPKGLIADAIPDAASARDYARYLMEEGEPAAAIEVWRWCHDRGFEDDRLTVDYVTWLLRKQKFEAAQEGWNKHFASRAATVFNGGFEYEFAGSDLDWHFGGFNGVTMARDSSSFFDGRFSLRVDFKGNDNPDFHHVAQSVFLQPGRYRFEAHMRTAGITSDQGLRFTIRAARSNAVLAETEALTGTNDWRTLATDVQVPAGVTMGSVELARHPSLRMDNQLTGTVWIDGVTLTRMN